MISITDSDTSRKKIYGRVAAVLLALAVWQLAALFIHQDILLAGPVQVAARLCTIWREPEFMTSIGFTFVHIAGGFLAGVLLGLVLAFLSDRFPLIETLLWPYMVTVKSVPVASIVVICLIWFTAGNLSIFISFLIVLPMIYSNVLMGLKKRDPELEEVSKVFGITGTEKIRTVLFPQIGSYLYSACSVAAGVAWKAGVAAEVIGIPAGSIGRQLYLSKIYLDTDDLFAWTVVIVVISAASEKLFILLLKRILGKWCGI